MEYLICAAEALGVLTYSFNSSTWIASGATSGKYRGLIASTSGDTGAVLMSIEGELDTLIDSSRCNGMLSARPTKIASAASNTLMCGIAFAPVNPAVAVPHASVSTPLSFGSINIGASSGAQAITLSNDGDADLHDRDRCRQSRDQRRATLRRVECLVGARRGRDDLAARRCRCVRRTTARSGVCIGRQR